MTTPDDIRRDIERKRGELSSDVNALAEKVSPTRVMERQVGRAKESVSSVKDKVMGTVEGAVSSVQDAAHSASGAASPAAAPQAVKARAQGNPLAVGVIAFGTGWLLSSLMPATAPERHATGALKEKVEENADLLKAPVAEMAHEAVEHLREPAQEAVESLKSTATEAVASVKDEATSAGGDVADQAKQAKEHVTNG